MASKRKLSSRAVETERRVGYHADGQQPGLYMQVHGGGAGLTRSWIYRYTSPLTGKRREMGLGATGIRSLAEARAAATQCSKLVLEGLDPVEEKRREAISRRSEQAATITFDEATRRCIAAKAPEWKNAKHAQQWENTLATYAAPVIGSQPVNAIDTAQVLRVLEPIWVTKTETATRVRQRIEKVLDWAKARGYLVGDNPARLDGNLRELLPRASKTKRVQHHPALPFKKINTFIVALRKQSGSSPLALEFLILTAARTSEVTGARWGEIDLDSRVWTVPAARMKAGVEHRVPLCDRAVEILASVNTNQGPDHFVFPGWKNATSLSNGAMLALMGKLNYGQFTPHGFRSCFRDWAAEEAHGFQNETVELALAHVIKNQAERAYRRGDQLERRRDLMREWGRYVEVDQAKVKGKIIALKRKTV
jgi:integrase